MVLGTELDLSNIQTNIGSPTWIDNNRIACFGGNSRQELIVFYADGTSHETIVTLPDSLANPSHLYYVPN